jgi:hypothetical protein
LIEINITRDGRQTARVVIEPLGDALRVKAIVNRPNGDVAMHNRLIEPMDSVNDLGLLFAALTVLGPETMKAEADEQDPAGEQRDGPRTLGRGDG